MDILEYFDS